MNASCTFIGLLLLLAGLFGMIPLLWLTFNFSTVSWALVFVVGCAILFQRKVET